MNDLLHQTEGALEKFELCTKADHRDDKLKAAVEAQHWIMKLILEDSNSAFIFLDRFRAHAQDIDCKVITMRDAS